MGAAMVARIRECGPEVVVYNRSRDRADKVGARTGASVASTAAEAASRADVVLVSLADDAACLGLYGGPDGLVAGVRPGVVVADTSTIDPQTVLALAARVESRGASLLDAPVSGSVPAAMAGTLTIMVGGDPAALDRARSVLALIGRTVMRVGDQGAGAIVKLAVNDVVHALNQALSEAIVLAERAGVGRSTLYDVLADSAVAAPFVGYKRAAFEDPESAPVAFSLDLVAKDYDLILALADRVGARMDQARTGRATVGHAVEAGLGGRDMSALAELLRSE
jgi:3-hydroxyisobutyrate dehydrogenase-like beta-hydroxyacid dehydrogenase